MADIRSTFLFVDQMTDTAGAERVGRLAGTLPGVHAIITRIPRICEVTYDAGMITPNHIMTAICGLGIKTAETT